MCVYLYIHNKYTQYTHIKSNKILQAILYITVIVYQSYGMLLEDNL